MLPISPILPDFPTNTKRGFTEEEIALAQLRMEEDTGEVGVDTMSFSQGFKLCVTDPKVRPFRTLRALETKADMQSFLTLTDLRHVHLTHGHGASPSSRSCPAQSVGR